MEFALEKKYPRSARYLFASGSVKMRFTPVCVSSKLPLTGQTITFSPSCVDICSFCTRLTPYTG